jgi:hypothetical protein
MISGIILILVEIVFICACCTCSYSVFGKLTLEFPTVGYAAWRAARYPGTKGRTSLDLDAFSEVQTWGFANPHETTGNRRESRQVCDCDKKIHPFFRFLMVLFGDKDLINVPHYKQRRPSTPTLEPNPSSSRKRRSWRDFPRMLRILDALKNEVRISVLTGQSQLQGICSLPIRRSLP